MNRPTVADLAKAAGVSISTINRLMLGTAKVRPETVGVILDAAQRIGFYGLPTLRDRQRGNLPRRKLAFLLQQSHRSLYQLWAKGILAAAERCGSAIIEPTLRFQDTLSPDQVASDLLELGTKSDAVAVVTADHPLVSQAIDQLHSRQVPVVAYITDLSAARRAGFVGTDNWKAGRTAAWFLSQMTHQPGKIVPFIGSHRYQCQDISDASFRSYIREHAPDLEVNETLLTLEEPDRAYRLVGDLIRTEPDLVGIFVNGGGISGVLRALREVDEERRQKIRLVCRDIGPEGKNGLIEGLITAAIPHSLKRSPEELIDVMLQVIEHKNAASVQQRLIPFDLFTPESVWM